MMLNDQQVAFVEKEIRERGITHPDLADSLVDHFCCVIEFEMEQGINFENAWRKAYLQVCPDGLQEINREVQQIITHQKHHTMKKFVFILGFLSALLFTVGYLFKILHWPTADINMIIGSSVFSLGFLPMYFLMKFRIDQGLGSVKPKSSYMLNFALALIICIGVPYKIMGLPGANFIFFANCFIFTLIFLPKVFLSWYKKAGELKA